MSLYCVAERELSETVVLHTVIVGGPERAAFEVTCDCGYWNPFSTEAAAVADGEDHVCEDPGC